MVLFTFVTQALALSPSKSFSISGLISFFDKFAGFLRLLPMVDLELRLLSGGFRVPRKSWGSVGLIVLKSVRQKIKEIIIFLSLMLRLFLRRCLTEITTVCLEWNHHFSLGQRLRHVNPLGTTYRVASAIEMTVFYDARGLFWSLRPQNMINFLPQSALCQICMGKWPVSSLAEFIHHVLVVPCAPEF